MIGDLFGNIGQQQEKIKEKLDGIEINSASQNKEIQIIITAGKSIKDIKIDASAFDLDDAEQLEDLLLVTLNKAMEEADQIAAEETQKLISDMLPPGFGNLFG
jgi:DNA-binding protein YbaB